MKSEHRFIPDTISGISTNSKHIQGVNNQSGTGYQSDSVDHLASDILKGRALRMKQQQNAMEKDQNASIDDLMEKRSKLKESKDSADYLSSQILKERAPRQIKQQQNGTVEDEQMPGSSKQKESTIKYQQKVTQIKPSEVSQEPQIKASVKKGNAFIVIEPQQVFPKKQRKYLTQHSELNQSNQRSVFHEWQQKESPPQKQQQAAKSQAMMMMETQKEDVVAITISEQNNKAFQKEDSQFELPKVDKINNQSIDLSLSQHDKSLKFAASLAPEQAGSDYIQLGMEHTKNIMENQNNLTQKIQEKQDEIIYQVNVHHTSSPAESGISMEPSQIQIPQIETKNQFSPIPPRREDETDEEMVQALTDRLNQINQIQEAEALQKHRQSIKNQSHSFTAPPRQSDNKNQREVFNFGSEVRTSYTEDIRDVKILEHHYESNIQYLQDQTTMLLELLEALILDMECIEYRGKVKQKQLENRKYRINYRNASYSKRFNFHSPIPKNNNTPLEYFKRFKVSPNLAGQYYDIIKKTEEQKQRQKQLAAEYKVLCNYYELMKTKKLTKSYPALPFQMQFDNEMQQYVMVSQSISSNQHPTVKTRGKDKYQFNKSKRTVQLDNNTEVNYYDMLTYKKDICKDAILQFEVFNLGKVKKIKDQNKLIEKEIDFVDQQIQKIDKCIRESGSPNQLKEFSNSQQILKTKKSIYKSPLPRTSQYISPAQRVQNRNKSNLSQRGRSSLSSTNKFRTSTSREVKKIALFKKTQSRVMQQTHPIGRTISPKHTLGKSKIIQQIEDDYGLSNIHIQNKLQQEIPTFGRQQSEELILSAKASSSKILKPQSPTSKQRKNFIQINKKLSTRTETNIGEYKSRQKLKANSRHSEYVSPIPKHTKTEPSNSVDQSNGNLANLL